MAKSKNGGTRSMIRGRVGSDVYSLGRDAQGNRQQVVRSLAVQVANPQTIAQMTNRMIMSTVMQAAHAFAPIIDHSFDGVPKGQPSISEFISRNYALVKADVEAHPSSGNRFGLNEYHVKGLQNGTWLLSQGKAKLTDCIQYISAVGFSISGLNTATTLQDFMDNAGISKGDYLTCCAIGKDLKFYYFRISVKESADVTTTVTAENVNSLFDIEGNFAATASLLSGNIDFGNEEFTPGLSNAGGVIVSKKTANGYNHSTLQLPVASTPAKPKADDVLPSYPIGTEMFLNGGDI